MRKASVLLVLLCASASLANGSSVSWATIVGVITAPGTSNTVAGIMSGGAPWATTGGGAIVNLSNGDISFQVKGLNLIGTNNTGTPGGVTAVKGTLICNPGTNDQAVLDTPTVPLSPQGDAQFLGNLGTVPSTCNNPLFLVRVGAGAWIATGMVRATQQ